MTSLRHGRPGRIEKRSLTVLAGTACLTVAACGAPGGVAGVSTLPPTSPAAGIAVHVAASSAEPVQPPPKDEPVLVPPPKLSPYTYSFPVKGCKTSYARKLLVLPKTTIWARAGCEFVSPVDGVIREVNDQDRWQPATDRGEDREGRFVTILGDDGVLYLGGHLDSIESGIRPGTRVKSGQRLGRVGNSGNARDAGSNLYFAISWPTPPEYWWVRRGMIKPWRYLDAWDDGNRTLSPRQEMLATRKRVGERPRCDKLCTPATRWTEPPKPNPKPTPSSKPRKTSKPQEPVVVPTLAG